jgi:hypothetical protein
MHKPFLGINLITKHAAIVIPETSSLWARLSSGDRDDVKIKMNAAEFPYILSCISYYDGSHRKYFAIDDTFLDLSTLQAGHRGGGFLPSPNRSTKDELTEFCSCEKLLRPSLPKRRGGDACTG